MREGQQLSPLGVGEEPVVADLDEVLGRNVLNETADEVER